MIDLVDLVPTMEHAMQGSVTFAALAHGVDVFWKRLINWLTERRWAKQDDEWAKIAADVKENSAEKVKNFLKEAEDVKETVKSKVKKNG